MNKLIAKDFCRQSYLLIKIYLILALSGILMPFGYYMYQGWIVTHSGAPAANGLVRVPNFNVLGAAVLSSCKIEQLLLFTFGSILLGTGIYFGLKNKLFFWRRLGIALLALTLAIVNFYGHIYNCLFNWLFSGL